tara:strand:- start:99 stop:383 length:285 start_codon:yes stop_codon:yes gene_type:complete
MDTNLSIKRTIYISCDTFGGFKRTIEINDCNNKQDVINRMICLLEQFLNNEDLHKLKTKLESIKHLFHIHDYDFGDMLLNDQTYYICNHGCNET